MKFLKGNQVIIYIIALMLITAGYLNYTDKNNTQQTNAELNTQKIGEIGDATLVSSSDVVTNETPVGQKSADNTNETNSINSNETNKNLVNNENTNNTENTNTNVQSTATTTSSNDYFVKSKLERESMYSQMLETYNKVLNSNNSSETQKQSATDEITKINQTKNSIMICENLIKTKGFENSIVFVNGDSINVIIGTQELEKEQVAQIQNIIERELNAKATNIHIATK